MAVTPLDWLLKTSDHFPQIIGTFNTPASIVTIQVWDITDAVNILISVINNNCYAIGATGRWGWSTAYLPPTQKHPRQYLYVMTSDIPETFDGQFILDTSSGAKWIYPDSQGDHIKSI